MTLGWLRSRRGDPEVTVLLDEALDLARATGHLQRLWPVASCRAERAWLGGRLGDEAGLLEDAAALAAPLGYVPAIEELAHWHRLVDGQPRGRPEDARTAFGLSAAGRLDLAAERWASLCCPDEEAMAHVLVRDVDHLRAAHRIVERLGAAPLRGARRCRPA